MAVPLQGKRAVAIPELQELGDDPKMFAPKGRFLLRLGLCRRLVRGRHGGGGGHERRRHLAGRGGQALKGSDTLADQATCATALSVAEAIHRARIQAREATTRRSRRSRRRRAAAPPPRARPRPA